MSVERAADLAIPEWGCDQIGKAALTSAHASPDAGERVDDPLVQANKKRTLTITHDYSLDKG